jgi:sugar lactone lactonase YvrE
LSTPAWRAIARPDCDRLGEGLHWAERENAVYWTDILNRRFHRLDLASGDIQTWPVGEMIGWVIGRQGGGLVAGLEAGVAAITLDPFAVTPFASLPEHPAANRMNDAVADAHGRIWAGTMPVAADVPTGGLYRIDPDGTVTLMDRDYTIANGPTISPGGEWLYHTDTRRAVIYRYALHAGGSLGERVPFIRFQREWGNPDGMCTDAEGGIWVAHWGGACVTRFSPAGERERSIALPASQITNVAFAGAELDRMFVTSAADGLNEEHGGALFEVESGARGLPTLLFAG